MSTIEETLTAAELSAVIFAPLSCGIYLISGADAPRYLHGRVTQDIKALKSLEAADTLILTPQGRVLGQLLIVNLGSTFLVLSDPLSLPEQRSDLLRSLLLFKVADDVQSEDLSERYGAIKVVGARAAAVISQALGLHFETLSMPKLPCALTSMGAYVLHRPLGEFDSFDIIAPQTELESLRSKLIAAEPGLLAGDLQSYEAVRITAGVPQMGSEINDKLIGADLPLERTVAFRKGCYAGQEVIEMATARGRPNRRLIAIRIESAEKIAAGDEIFVEAEGGRSSVGAITSAVFLPQRGETRALAFIKNSVADGTQLFAGTIPAKSCNAGR